MEALLIAKILALMNMQLALMQPATTTVGTTQRIEVATSTLPTKVDKYCRTKIGGSYTPVYYKKVCVNK